MDYHVSIVLGHYKQINLALLLAYWYNYGYGSIGRNTARL